MVESVDRFVVLGSGAMGTACAVLLAGQAGAKAAVWCPSAQQARDVSRTGRNDRYLPGVDLPGSLLFTDDFAAALAHHDDRPLAGVVIAIPTLYLGETLRRLSDRWPSDAIVVSVVKGIEQETLRRPSEIVADALGPRRFVALSGPSHAEEIVRGLPASVAAAGTDADAAEAVQHWFSTDRFRVYTSPDLLGVELAGALKNVIALAAGVSDGLGLGDNAKAALMTRGLVEMVRFGVEMGAQWETFYGLAGFGDLITTCCSRHGRNRYVGERIGRGEKLVDVLADMRQVAEGVWTTRSVLELAARRSIDMPVTHEVHQVLFEQKDPRQAVADLMTRHP
ncbi:MAG: NAD(P)H-dependent glycerol-3-phosphate dehydrogenase, partial [Planctomycetia bacterium]